MTDRDLSGSSPAARGSVFDRLSATWERRAQVRSFRWDTAPAWDPAKDDFLAQLLPFGAHPAFLAASPEQRARCLAAAWLAFNENQVGFELSIVIPDLRPAAPGPHPRRPRSGDLGHRLRGAHRRVVSHRAHPAGLRACAPAPRPR